MTTQRSGRITDSCLRCGRFVGIYPVGFYDDQFCGPCFDAIAERGAKALAARDGLEAVFHIADQSHADSYRESAKACLRAAGESPPVDRVRPTDSPFRMPDGGVRA